MLVRRADRRGRRARQSSGGASWKEQGDELTLAGVTVLRFDDEGKVVDHRDYWNEIERREPPYHGW